MPRKTANTGKSAEAKEKARKGAFIKEFRESKGWSAEELAEKLGVNLTAVYSWERGEYHVSAENYIQLANLAAGDWRYMNAFLSIAGVAPEALEAIGKVVRKQEEVKGREEAIARLARRRDDAASRINDLQKERKSVLIAARAQDDATASIRLREIDEAIQSARREQVSDAEVIVELSAQLEPVRSQLQTATRQAQREQLRRAIATYLGAVESALTRMGELLGEAAKIGEGLAPQAKAIFNLAREFDAQWFGENILDFSREDPQQVGLTADLREIEKRASFSSRVIQERFARVLSAIESAPIEGEVERSSGQRLYVALSKVRYSTRELSAGDRIWLLPTEAEPLVQSGALRGMGDVAAPVVNQVDISGRHRYKAKRAIGALPPYPLNAGEEIWLYPSEAAELIEEGILAEVGVLGGESALSSAKAEPLLPLAQRQKNLGKRLYRAVRYVPWGHQELAPGQEAWAYPNEVTELLERGDLLEVAESK